MAITVEQAVESTTGVRPYSIALSEFEQMIEAGIFDPIFRLELIRGELIEHMPPGQEHESCVARIHRIFSKLVDDNALIWPHGNSIGIPDSNSRPQPDIALLRWRDDLYAGKRPSPGDVILVVEVSKSTLAFDREVKVALYAEAGIPEYWIVNLIDNVIEGYKDPSAGKYQTIRKAKLGETLQLPADLQGNLAVNDILG